MRLTGTLLEVENYSGEFADKQTGEAVAYAGQRWHVLDGREVIKVKLPKELIDELPFEQGDAVDLRVEVGAQSGARGAYLTVKLLGEYSQSPVRLSVAQ
jgi:hypothetical protein